MYPQTGTQIFITHGDLSRLCAYNLSSGVQVHDVLEACRWLPSFGETCYHRFQVDQV